MSAKLLCLIATAVFLTQVQVDARQPENDAPIRAGQSSSAPGIHGLALANHDTKADRSPDVVVDLSGIDGAAVTSAGRGSGFGAGPSVVDPLDSPLGESADAPANWLAGTDMGRWTRHPVAAAVISFVLVLFGYGLLRMMRGRSPSRRPGRLPRQVIELIGFVPLSPRQQLQLVRLGSKLVLVAVSANGAEPLAEITDPVEVDQILAACSSGQSALASAIGRWSGRQSPREYSNTGDRRGARALFEA